MEGSWMPAHPLIKKKSEIKKNKVVYRIHASIFSGSRVEVSPFNIIEPVRAPALRQKFTKKASLQRLESFHDNFLFIASSL